MAAGYRWRRLHGELALAATVESPHILLVRPGVRYQLVDIADALSLSTRAAGQILFGTNTVAGLLVAPGVDYRLTSSWVLAAEIDVSVWFVSAAVVPVELRMGARYEF